MHTYILSHTYIDITVQSYVGHAARAAPQASHLMFCNYASSLRRMFVCARKQLDVLFPPSGAVRRRRRSSRQGLRPTWHRRYAQGLQPTGHVSTSRRPADHPFSKPSVDSPCSALCRGDLSCPGSPRARLSDRDHGLGPGGAGGLEGRTVGAAGIPLRVLRCTTSCASVLIACATHMSASAS